MGTLDSLDAALQGYQEAWTRGPSCSDILKRPQTEPRSAARLKYDSSAYYTVHTCISTVRQTIRIEA